MPVHGKASVRGACVYQSNKQRRLRLPAPWSVALPPRPNRKKASPKERLAPLVKAGTLARSSVAGMCPREELAWASSLHPLVKSGTRGQLRSDPLQWAPEGTAVEHTPFRMARWSTTRTPLNLVQAPPENEWRRDRGPLQSAGKQFSAKRERQKRGVNRNG